MSEIIDRTAGRQLIWHALERYQKRVQSQSAEKSVCVVSGFSGCGKTTLLLNYYSGKKVFYFSFAGLEEGVALRLLAQRVQEKTDEIAVDWAGAFSAISRNYRHVIFDDVEAVATYKHFSKTFYENMTTDSSRPFVVLIGQTGDDMEGLADKYERLRIDYFSIPDVMKLFPKILKIDVLGLCTISGGIPGILMEYDPQRGFEENLRRMLRPDSAFCRFMPELLMRYFRRPENYNQVLYAIASGKHCVSDIGKFTGFEYNKCDNYLSALVSHGLIYVGKETSKRGALKTVYHFRNNYFALWYRYIYPNRTALQLGDQQLIEDIVQSTVTKEIHAFHLEKAFNLARARIYRESIGLNKGIVYSPETVRKGKFKYTFDAIARDGEKTVFVKVFEDADENCKAAELVRIRKAVSLVNEYYNSRVLIFSKRRFSEYVVHEASIDETISLIEVDRLKY